MVLSNLYWDTSKKWSLEVLLRCCAFGALVGAFDSQALLRVSIRVSGFWGSTSYFPVLQPYNNEVLHVMCLYPVMPHRDDLPTTSKWSHPSH